MPWPEVEDKRGTPHINPSEGRTTRSAACGPKIQPKLKLKFSEKAAAQAPDLDSDKEDLVFKEQFILHMPANGTRNSRRALVDLPCIIESQKTLDNKQMFKVTDICQMLVVEEKIPSQESLSNQKGFNIDEFIWPYGVTLPLKHVCKRRFRKRTIETVEQEVEQLLEEDVLASEVRYEFIDREDALDATPGFGDEDGADEAGGVPRDEAEGNIDEELAAELDLTLEDEDGGDKDADEDEDEEDQSDSEDDDKAIQARKLLNEEIHDLEAAVAKKHTEIASSANPLTKHDEMKEQQQLRKEGIVPGGGGAAGASNDDDAGDEDEDYVP
ncbi:TAFII55 protein conserved region-domain-containing protein [Trametes meyenii]|nr:TAFII55 protein conserved region-domain-containing protein [Trametes meyenii]